jgi:hypothetical protein
MVTPGEVCNGKNAGGGSQPGTDSPFALPRRAKVPTNALGRFFDRIAFLCRIRPAKVPLHMRRLVTVVTNDGRFPMRARLLYPFAPAEE